MYRFLCILSLSIAIGHVQSITVQYKPCGTPSATIKSVDVDPCDNPSHCSLVKGTNPKITIVFTPKNEITALKSSIDGVLPAGMEAPFMKSDACKGSGLTCPVAANKESTYTTTVPVLQEYPEWKVVVKFNLTDDKNKVVVCVLVQTQITPGANETTGMHNATMPQNGNETKPQQVTMIESHPAMNESMTQAHQMHTTAAPAATHKSSSNISPVKMLSVGFAIWLALSVV